MPANPFVRISDSENIRNIQLKQGVAPTAPASGFGRLFATAQQLLGWIGSGGLAQTIMGCMYSHDGRVTVANTVTETTLLSAGTGTLTMPEAEKIAGRTIRIKGCGYLSNTGTPTLNLRVTGPGAIVSTGVHTTTAGLSNSYFEFEVIITRQIGSATAWAQGVLRYGTGTQVGMVNTSTIAFASGGAFNVTVQWGTASPSNTISLTNLTIEILN